MKKKQLIITGATVIVLALAFGVYAMTNNNDQNKDTKESSFTNPISEQKPVDETVVEDPETVPVPNPGNPGGGGGGQTPPAVVDPTASASQTFDNGTGTITVSVNSGTSQIDGVSISASGSDFGARAVDASGKATFSYQTVDGKPINTITVTIYDKSGKTYQSTHQL